MERLSMILERQHLYRGLTKTKHTVLQGIGQMLGFDTDFDLTAADTRAQARTRMTVGVVVFVFGLLAVDWPWMVCWAATFAFSDGLLWVATDPKNQRRAPVFFRSLRLGATALSTCAWVTAGVLWWFSGGGNGQAAGVALIAGVLVYMIRGCHKSYAQLMVTAAPPAAALLVLPFFEPNWTARLGLFSCTAMLVAYGLSSAVNAVRSYADLKRATKALTIKQKEAEAASDAKSEFLANMSHEIRTPLNGILAMAHILAEAPLPAREKEAARLIRSSGRTLERLLSDILDLAKVEAGLLDLELNAFHMGDLARGAAGLVRTQAEDMGLTLAVEIDAAAERWFQGDETRIGQVLMNLLSNAVKFTPHGTVRLSVSYNASDTLVISVEDTGIGFSAEEGLRIFDRFQQADGTITRRFGGTGLGLSISRHLVEKMGGQLAYESRVGKGSRFWFALSLPELDDAEAPLAAVAPRPIDMRILVVDDHPMNLKVVEIVLAGAGISVTAATNGREAVDLWEAEAFTLILMDMQMPVMDGLTATRMIRDIEKRSGRPRTPILMLTANASKEHVIASTGAGADGHLTKPINPPSLFLAIEDVLAGLGPVHLARGVG